MRGDQRGGEKGRFFRRGICHRCNEEGGEMVLGRRCIFETVFLFRAVFRKNLGGGRWETYGLARGVLSLSKGPDLRLCKYRFCFDDFT